MATLLVVDDDPSIRELVTVILKQEYFIVIEASDGQEALDIAKEHEIDMAIIDIMLPKVDGWDLCKEFRQWYDFPILMLTAKGESIQKIKGFNLGADDYMVKPFEPLELLLRIKAILRRYQINQSHTVQIGELWMNKNTYEVSLGQKSYTLPLKEFNLLFKLAENPGRTYTRDQLIEFIWGMYFSGNDRTLDVHINRLRERLKEQSSFQIKTIRGLGYRLEVLS
ncbi:response regulator transcription factor [Paenibacillus tundrae]|uniref:Heme response regulator HssR n=1 Tax=Paenibacillus tundrae TaxID=528187 RepID=A0ABT9W7Q6_9BACL|nr:response regulator transcription factor [Paenibacillus tundrae]MDQ0169278.1 DNA-binding response OmpR family regulator [Paenibacillus tundrae]